MILEEIKFIDYHFLVYGYNSMDSCYDLKLLKVLMNRVCEMKFKCKDVVLILYDQILFSKTKKLNKKCILHTC